MRFSGSTRQIAACLCIAVSLLALSGSAAWSAPFAYIPNFGSNTVSIIDIATNTVVKTVASGGAGPNAVAVSADGAKVHVTNQNPAPIGALNNGSVGEIDGTTNTFVVLKKPDVIAKIAAGGMDAIPSASPQAFAAEVALEAPVLDNLMQTLGARVD